MKRRSETEPGRYGARQHSTARAPSSSARLGMVQLGRRSVRDSGGSALLEARRRSAHEVETARRSSAWNVDGTDRLGSTRRGPGTDWLGSAQARRAGAARDSAVRLVRSVVEPRPVSANYPHGRRNTDTPFERPPCKPRPRNSSPITGFRPINRVDLDSASKHSGKPYSATWPVSAAPDRRTHRDRDRQAQ